MRGLLTARDEITRVSFRVGDLEAARKTQKRNGGNVVVTAAAQERILKLAGLEAARLIANIEDRCRRVLENAAVSPKDQYPQAIVQRQLVEIIERYIDYPVAEFASARPTYRIVQTKSGPRKRRPMKIRNQAAFDEWQTRKAAEKKKKALYQAAKRKRELINATAAEKKRDRARVARLKQAEKGDADPPKLTAREQRALRTLHQRELNKGIIEESLADPSVRMVQWTTARDSKVCATCAQYELWVVPLGDNALYMFTAPLHPNCRCRWMPVPMATEKAYGIKKTRKADWPDFDEFPPAEGFGGLRVSA